MRKRDGWVVHIAKSWEEAAAFDKRWHREMTPEQRLDALADLGRRAWPNAESRLRDPDCVRVFVRDEATA
ncbi:MAG TPA: hypothetical protein QGF58_14070 [Myxococcota bacterium]|nr:hypothetical protein [Myxococcota bacterium]